MSLDAARLIVVGIMLVLGVIGVGLLLRRGGGQWIGAGSDWDTLSERDHQIMFRQLVALGGCLVIGVVLFFTRQFIFLLGLSLLLGYAGWTALRDGVNVLGTRVLFRVRYAGWPARLAGLFELAVAVGMLITFVQRVH